MAYLTVESSNGIGSLVLSPWLGGTVIAAGFGYTASNWVGAVPAVSVLLLAFLSAALERRETTSGPIMSGAVPRKRRTAVHR